MASLIEIDASYSKESGQILRTATSLSIITKKPCRVFNIRKGLEKPGLAPQYLLEIQALSRLCNGGLEKDEFGSQEVKFYPGKIESKNLQIKIRGAGSITLILQSLVLPALFAQSQIKISFNGGATDTFFSPTIDHFQYVFLKTLERMGAKTKVNILKRGYYPEGGASLEVIIYPSKLKSIKLTAPGALKKIVIISGASESLREKKVAERQLAGTREILGKLKLPIEEKAEYYPSQCSGSQICLAAEFENTTIGTDNLGKLGKRAEDVGREAALELLKEQKNQSCLDKRLADQILPYLAMAAGKSQVMVSEITERCKTNIWIVEKFIDSKFKIKDNLITWQPG